VAVTLRVAADRHVHAGSMDHVPETLPHDLRISLQWAAANYWICSRPDPPQHKLVDLIGSHAYQRDGIDLLLGQAASSKRRAFI
jgi:hypothetical protein